ncbi:PREDICTED: uncharacterized protein LOC105361515 [Ceratosolen solmsi marchali]|uniref:Uncharacterized protein LOC105361515 n=1 Tax=Ceratosolen solmsi marchali TaxID=326594 RepID=A0AAJ7DUM4_9HYME|nr:PREDICTED: uncharacterized protein LOC105361515 [Ceratosolen solmsi marchali]
MSDTKDYEAFRERNIAERNAFLKEFLKEIKEDTAEINRLESSRLNFTRKKNRCSKILRFTTKKYHSDASKSKTYPDQCVDLSFRKKYNTRSKKRKLEESNDNNDDNDNEDIIVPKKGSNLKVMFSWSRPIQRDIDLMRFDFSEDESEGTNTDVEDYIHKKKKIHRISKVIDQSIKIPSLEEITKEMLNNIAVKASGKNYDAINGTSCHQCRQKTIDTKTFCRSGKCIGVRGQFCGPCLMGRYGESALNALQDPNWVCPPCRNLCNCSICRTRKGQRPTGILAPLAREEGYDSVKDYLQALDCKK